MVTVRDTRARRAGCRGHTHRCAPATCLGMAGQRVERTEQLAPHHCWGSGVAVGEWMRHPPSSSRGRGAGLGSPHGGRRGQDSNQEAGAKPGM